MSLQTSRARRAAGMCHDCTSPAEPGRRYCVIHRDDTRARTRASTARLRAAGLCVECRQPSAGRRCRACLDRINARNKAAMLLPFEWRGVRCPAHPLAASELTGGAYVRLLVPLPVARAVQVVARRRGLTQAEAFALIVALPDPDAR